MSSKIYSLIGFLGGEETGDTLQFLTPIFQSGNQLFSCEVDSIGYVAEKFSPYNGEYKALEEVDFCLVHDIGLDDKERYHVPRLRSSDPAVFIFEIKEKYFIGNRRDTSIYLFGLLRDHEFEPLEKYDIFTHIGIPSKVNESIKDTIALFHERSIPISYENFYVSDQIEVTYEQFSFVLGYYGQLINRAKNMIDVSHYFQIDASLSESVVFCGYQISRADLVDRFDELLKMRGEIEYHDLVCYCYAKYEIGELDAYDSKNFRIDKLFEMIPTDPQMDNDWMRLLLDNSQSRFGFVRNAAIRAKEIEEKMNFEDIELGNFECLDFGNKVGKIPNLFDLELNRIKELIKEGCDA